MRWLVAQRWENLLFAHWPVEPDAVARHLLPTVEPDTRDGGAWVGIVAFVMTGTRSCAGPYRPALPPIPELNVRTYVRVGDVPGVWFLSLDATSTLFGTLGRALYGLRYHRARMSTVVDGCRIHYLSARTGAAFSVTYEPIGPPACAPAGTLESFLFERYRLFSERRGGIVTAEVAHEPWPLQPAHARIDVNRMAPHGLTFDGRPLLHFSRSIDALISAPELVAPRRAQRPRRALAVAEVSHLRLARRLAGRGRDHPRGRDLLEAGPLERRLAARDGQVDGGTSL